MAAYEGWVHSPAEYLFWLGLQKLGGGTIRWASEHEIVLSDCDLGQAIEAAKALDIKERTHVFFKNYGRRSFFRGATEALEWVNEANVDSELAEHLAGGGIFLKIPAKYRTKTSGCWNLGTIHPAVITIDNNTGAVVTAWFALFAWVGGEVINRSSEYIMSGLSDDGIAEYSLPHWSEKKTSPQIAVVFRRAGMWWHYKKMRWTLEQRVSGHTWEFYRSPALPAKSKPKIARSLGKHIERHYDGNQAAFAAAQGVQPPQVTQWLKKDFVVVDGGLYSFRRQLSK